MQTGASVNTEQAEPSLAHRLNGLLQRGRDQEEKGDFSPAPWDPGCVLASEASLPVHPVHGF